MEERPRQELLANTKQALDANDLNAVDLELLHAGQLGSIQAQRTLGVNYATGDWSGPKDLAEAARWYRLAAENGHAESQYDLAFMLLLGEGGPKNIDEGLMWLERAGEQGEHFAFRLLVDCYEDGCCGVPIDPAKAQLWRTRLEQFERLNPLKPSRWYSIEGNVSESSLECLFDIEGVIGFSFASGDSRVVVSYEPTRITAAELDEKVRAAGLKPISRCNLRHPHPYLPPWAESSRT